MKLPFVLLVTIFVAASLQGCRLETSQSGQTDRAWVEVEESRPNRPGYERSCKPGHRCVFGPAWADDVEVAGGHNGCDTRNDMLVRDLKSVKTKPGTSGCVVTEGILHDPYSGATVTFTRGSDSFAVQIDHVYPLAAAWDFGADKWSLSKRKAFANDPENLITTTAAMNQSKGDKTPESWMPPAGHCEYASTYVKVANKYRISVSLADKRALEHTLTRCTSSHL